jgi:hypothetical protein
MWTPYIRQASKPEIEAAANDAARKVNLESQTS